MKFSEALQITRLRHSFDGTMWCLASYNPFVLKTFLQAHLIKNSEKNQMCYEVKNFDYDVLRRALEETSSDDKRADPAVLSLMWEDFIPALGWRSRQSGSARPDLILEPSEALCSSIVQWGEDRSKIGGLSIVLLPPLSWLPPTGGEPSFLLDSNHIELMTWRTKFSQDLKKRGMFVFDLGQPKLNLRDMLSSGSPWALEEAREISSKIAAMIAPLSARIKAIVVDLDNTLWQGILEDGSALQNASEESWNHKPYHVFASMLLSQKKRGIFLACCSKNDLGLVQENFSRLNNAMSLEDFNAVVIDWSLKSAGIAHICASLNILPQNVLFVDDNPAELLEVQNKFPEIICLKTPNENETQEWLDFYAQFKEICFRPSAASLEDTIRVQDKHAVERKALSSHAGGTSLKEYLRSLKLVLEVQQGLWEEKRTLDLINKTNQFTLNGNRYTPSQFLELRKDNSAWCLSGNLTDIHGVFGTIAVMCGHQTSEAIFIDAMAVSCRAFDRNVEYAFLQALLQIKNCKKIVFVVKETPRNAHARKFLESLALSWEQTELLDIPSLLGVLENKCSEAGTKVVIR
ncbi:MAG: HAD-IIIC family phosphatase [Deltaproteobacteria bacterium]|nr:HAD-IIIC family phosphatase [Deltaproteobacteria bacterium]